MKVCWRGFLGKNHSWSIVGQSICRQLIKQGHEVDMFSTNGTSHFPDDLRPYLKGFVEEQPNMSNGELNTYLNSVLQPEYEIQLSYTAMRNFGQYFTRGSKNRFAIWCYEMAGRNALPDGFAKYYKYVDRLIPPSNFAKQVFLDSGVPESAMTMIPHGFDADKYLDRSRPAYPLKTKKRFKILANIAQPHIRKNLEGLLAAYGKAFTNKDDVCLVLKVVDKIPTLPFEVSFKALYQNFLNKYKNHAEVEIITQFIPDIASLYHACDAIFSMTRSECFWLPGLEALAAGLIVIVSGWGGQLDFLNNDNALLINGKEVPVPIKAFYWGSKIGPHYFEPNIDDAAEKLQYAYHNTIKLKDQTKAQAEDIVANYTWDKVTSKILELVKS